MSTIEDIAAAVARLQRENAELRAQIDTLRMDARHRGGGRRLPVLLLSAIVVAGVLSVTGGATSGAESGQPTFRVPFEVANASGSPVMRVTQSGVTVYASDNQPVAELKSDTGSGVLILAKGGSAPSVTLQATYGSTGGGIFQMTYGGKPTVILGFSPTGEAQLALLNQEANATVFLAQKQSGGYLGLANPGGIARVEAGVLGDVGEVRAIGPGGMGLGSYIKGK
jgi:hypothetical protein